MKRPSVLRIRSCVNGSHGFIDPHAFLWTVRSPSIPALSTKLESLKDPAERGEPTVAAPGRPPPDAGDTAPTRAGP